MIDIRAAAALTGRHPETVRRWVWSGKLPARRRGNRILVARADVEAIAGSAPKHGTASLSAWRDRASATRRGPATDGACRSAADLVLEDRREREQAARAGR